MSPSQVNVQAPDGVTGLVNVVVNTPGGRASGAVTVADKAPSFLLLDDKHVAAIILRPDGTGAYGGGIYDIVGPTGASLGYPTTAVRAGDIVELFPIGLGPTNPPVSAGAPFSGAARLIEPVTVGIGKVSVTPAFAGMSGAGLYQINVVVPAGITPGDVPVSAVIGNAKTQAGVVLSVQ